MPVKIRLTRMGKKKQPSYRVVVVDSRKPRDGAHIEQIGRYDPRQDPSIIEIDNDRALKWLQDGAQPTERARKLLEISGAWSQFRIARGDIHTIADTPSEDAATSAIAEVEAVEAVEPPAVAPEPEAAVEPAEGDAGAGTEDAADTEKTGDSVAEPESEASESQTDDSEEETA